MDSFDRTSEKYSRCKASGSQPKRHRLAAERDESSLVWAAQAQSLPVEHRADINPVALLGLAIVTAPRANPSPRSSPGCSRTETTIVSGSWET